jgi:hypothetical protein
MGLRPLTPLKGRACLAAVRRRENNDEPGQHSFWCRLSIYASSRKAVPGDDFGFEQFASDDMIGDKLTEAAFSEVEVTGGGGTRTAEGRWGKPDVTGQIDHHIVSVTEIA